MQLSEQLHRIIVAGTRAPSGDNTQPWSFRVTGSTIDVLAYPERDNPIYNFHYRGTRIAIGAVVENMVQAAAVLGFDASVSFFPLNTTDRLAARIVCSEKTAGSNLAPLDAIERRVTNRRAYDRMPLTSAEKAALMAAGADPSVRFCLLEDRSVQKQVARAVSVNEWILLRNKELHHSFFPQVIWTEEEERKKKTGLYFPTLELKPHEGAIFKLFQYWSLARVFQWLGFPSIVAKSNAATYASGSAIGVLIVSPSDDAFYAAGRVLERIWLAATSSDLAMQPITAIAYMAAHVKSGEPTVFSPKEKEVLLRAYEQVSAITQLVPGKEEIAMIFRVGHAPAPSARVSRIAPNIEFINQ